MEIKPVATHEERVSAGDERAVLEAFLDRYRDIVVAKVAGLPEVDAARPLEVSGTSPAGLVKHLRWVEVGWFHQVLGAASGDNLRPHERAWEFRVEPGETLAGFVTEYRAACDTSRRIAAAHSLDDRVPHDEMDTVTLRWIYVHMIEETARHCGHLDILREQLDGTTGFG